MKKSFSSNGGLQKNKENLFGRQTTKISVIICLIIVVLTLVSCASNSNKNPQLNNDFLSKNITETELIEIAFPLDGWSLAMSRVPGLPIEFNFDTPDVTVELTTDMGEFVIWPDTCSSIKRVYKKYTLASSGTLYWQNTDFSLGTGIFSGRDAFIKAIVYEGGHIVGFAVINIYSYSELDMSEGISFNAQLLKNVTFEKICGEYQSVSQDYVENEMNKVINKMYEIKATDITNASRFSFPIENWTMVMSSVPGLPINSDYDKALFFTDGGQFIIDTNTNIEFVGKHYILTNKGTIYWTNIDLALERGLYLERDAYVGVIDFDGEHIAGFSVINLYSYPELNMASTSYKVKLIKSVAFEKIEGEYQNITYDYVYREIDAVIYAHKNR